MARIQKFVAYTPLTESAHPSEKTPRGRVYRGVALIKAGLGNRRDRNYYPPEVLEEAVDRGLFEGLRAFADHPDSVSEEIQPERTIRDMVGVYENARYDKATKTVRADLQILRSQGWLSDTIDELIEIGHADKIGLSINGRGQTSPERMRLEESGDEEVEVNRLQKFLELRSTDVVTEAGAGGGFTALLESARRAKETTMGRDQVLAAMREAVRNGDLDKAKELDAKLAEEVEDDDTQEGCGGKRRRATEAEDAAHDEELDEAAEDAKRGTDLDEGDEEGDEGDEDLGEAEDGDEGNGDGDEGDEDVAPIVKAARRQKQFATHEASIHGATGTPTGSVKGGGGRFTRNDKGRKKSSKSPMALHKMREATSGDSEVAVLREQLAACRAKGARLAEALKIRASADRAKTLLRESNLPKEVRPHLIDTLLGKSDEEMRREIARQERIIEAAARRAKEDLLGEDFDAVEGAGSSIRESFTGSRDGSDLGDILAEVGLPMKR